jgi:DNA replication protein DnaC
MNDATVAGLKSLGFSLTVEATEALVEQAISESLTHEDFLVRVCSREVELRQERRAKQNESRMAKRTVQMLKDARIPDVKTLAEFDFDFQPTIDRKLVEELVTCGFSDRKENILFFGKQGTGKTYIAETIANEACKKGYSTLFTTSKELGKALRDAHAKNELAALVDSYAEPKLLVFDDIGYQTLDKVESTALFDLICSRYDKGLSIICTSNRSPANWNEIVGAPDQAAAVLDRLYHRAHIITILGPSHRLKGKRIPDLGDTALGAAKTADVAGKSA